ncbi:MAG: tetratricopeptide repeat protein, partial [Bacteroidetes bacterium]|nr:tetratricopeptide repeat protein [Bacteroidota bacterium]
KFILSSLDFEDEVRPSILFILLYRPEFDITKVMTELDDFIQLDIKPLKKKAVLKVMCSMLEGVKIPDKIASMIIDKSDGNPFYTEELTRKLVDDAIVQKINGQWIFQRDDVELSLPDTLNGLILSRIDGLEKSVRSTIQKGSVIGRDFLRKILKKVILKLDHKGPDEHLVVLGNYQLIFHDLEREHYWFKHMLTRDVAYNTLLKQNRKILHRVTAEVVEDNFPDESDEYSTFLAHHFGKAKIRDKQLVYCLKAMNFTQQKYDNESALKFGKQALDLMREIDNKNKNKICDLIGNIGIINMDLGKYKDAVKYFKEQVDLADEIGNSHFAGQAYGNMGTIYLHQGQFDKAEDSYEKLFLSTGQNKKQIAYAYGNIGIIKSMKGDLDTASDYHNRQLIACQELNDKIGIANALGNIGVVHFFRNDFDNAVDTWKDQSDILNEIGARKELTVPLGNLAEVQTLRGEFEIALTNYNRKVELCREIGDKRGIAITLGNIAENYFDQGNFEQSLDYCNRALKTSGKLGLSIEILKITLKKSDLLLANGEIENATQELRGIEDLMHKCNQPDLVFGYKRLYLELDFHQFEGDRQKQLDVLVSIDGLLTDSSDEQTANLNFLLGKLYEKLGSKETSFSYYRKALSKYNEIFKTSPKWLFQQNIELLTTKLTR